MSDKTTTTQGHPGTEQHQGAPEDEQRAADTAADTVTDQQDQQDGSKGGGNKEAMKYRRQLREAESERDGLASTVETLRRQVIAQAMPHGDLKADALWATGKTAADFYGESGELDQGALHAAAIAVREMVGLPPVGVVPGAGTGGGRVEATTTWADALKRRA